MNHSTRLLCAGAALSSALTAQAPTFADPVSIEAGGKILGHNRLYPSPSAHDLNGDGRVDLFVGDLRGRISYALRDESGDYGKEIQLSDSEGQPLDFSNW